MTKSGWARESEPFNPTEEMRDEVELLAACGLEHRAIASGLRINVLTLEKYFRNELDYGSPRKLHEILSMLYKSAKRGNVQAQKKLLEIVEKRATADQIATWAAEKSIPVRLQPGKKEQAAMDAKTAGDGNEWGDDLKFNGGALPN